jgi:hypothetical protein
MHIVMLKCPTTGREFSTGLHIKEADFRRLVNTVTKVTCPHCGLAHGWWTREARLACMAQSSINRKRSPERLNVRSPRPSVTVAGAKAAGVGRPAPFRSGHAMPAESSSEAETCGVRP